MKNTLLFFTFLLIARTIFSDVLHLRVMDKDLGVPLEGVQIRITGTEVSTERAANGRLALTNAVGEATFVINLGDEGAQTSRISRLVVTGSLIGYETERVLVQDVSKTVEIKMRLEGILRAEELIVEASAIGKTDDKVGVSVAVNKDTIKTTAVIGLIEDVMTTVKMLPGVTYAGAFQSNLSVRGGEPDGLTHVLDGFVVKFPYHWGNGVSIFNPHLVDSVKLSAGIFPVRYGQATSGLLEINTITPNDGLKWEFNSSISTLEGYVQAPIGDNSGILAGARLTNYDLVFAMTGNFLEDTGVTFSRVPYIYDFYLKWFLRPQKNFEWYINGFSGQDGIGIRALDPEVDLTREVSNTFDFVWTNRDSFLNTGVKYLPGDRLSLHFLGGYENWVSAADGSFTEIGTRFYSDEFIDRFGPFLGLTYGDFFSVDAQSGFLSENTLHHLQFRGDADYILNENWTLQTGAGVFASLFRYDTAGGFWNIVHNEDGSAAYKKTNFESSAEDTNIFVSFAYISAETVIIPDCLYSDFGLRIDHGYFQGEGDYSLNTLPVLGPRALFRLTPGFRASILESMTWSLGSGIFTKVPFDSLMITKEMGLEDFDVKIPKTFMTVLGWEGKFTEGYRFKIEGYYKFLYDRFYYNFVTSEESGSSRDIDIRVHNDGIGHAGGFDIIFDRRTSRFIDGMLSYSFIMARYLNPETDGMTAEDPTDPRDRWYYPLFHRFHSLNLFVNVKPKPYLTISSKLSFATGTPLPRYGDKEMFFARFDNRDGGESIAEMYTRRSFYDDYLRRGWVLPLDVKVAFHWYRKDSKIYHEVYIGAQDILSPILAAYGPDPGGVDTDRYTGEDTQAAESGFSFPVISLGYRASY